MNTDYLKEFIVLAETRNFWEASERLFLNQSTLSKHIRALESELGAALFSRNTRHVDLTNYGKIFLPYARSITRSEFEGITAVKRLQDVEKGILTIGTMPSMTQYRVTVLIAKFQQKYPEATIRITEDDPNNLFRYLDNENCEVIFSRESKSDFETNFSGNSRIQRIPYIKDHMVALMQKTHPLAGEKSVTLKQLEKEQFCLIKEGTLMHDLCMEACQRAGFVPDIIFTSHRIDSVIDMVTNQNCVALLMNQHFYLPENRTEQSTGPWAIIPIAPAIESQISLCYRTDRTLSKTAKLFVEFCEEHLTL